MDVDEVERRVNQTIQRLEGAPSMGVPAPAAAAAGPASEAGLAPLGSGEEAGAGQNVERADAAAEAEPGAAERPAAGEPDGRGEGGAAAAPATADAAGPAAEDLAADEPLKPPHTACGAPEGPLAMVDCSVCMCRPVQVWRAHDWARVKGKLQSARSHGLCSAGGLCCAA